MMRKDSRAERRAAKERKRRQARAERSRKRPAGAVGAARPSRGGYNPQRNPSAEAWRKLDDAAKLDAVADYHERALADENKPPHPTTHASLHVLVENQLAADQPPAARAALQRLMHSGLSRHDAIHAIGWVAIEHLDRARKARKRVDAAVYAKALDELTRESWLAAAGVEPAAGPLSAARRSD